MKGLQLGNLTIMRAVEMIMPLSRADFFPGTSKADWDPYREWLEPHAWNPVTDEILFTMQSYIVRTSHHTVLIDSCVGNDKDRPHRESWHRRTDDNYIRALAAHGLTPDDPDFDAKLATRTRRAFLQQHCDSNTLVCTAHFPLPSAGRVVRARDAFRMEAVDSTW